MQQETSFDFALFKVVDELLIFLGAERGRDERLGFTACEQRRAVYAWQPTYFRRDRTNLGEPPSIRTPALVKNIVAENHLLQVVEDQFGHGALFRLIFGVQLRHFL